MKALALAAVLAALCLPALDAAAQSPAQGVSEQRIEIYMKDFDFQFVLPTPIKPGLPTVLIIRNEGKVRHGFYSPMFAGILVRGESEGVVTYGKGVEGFYVDPGKKLVVLLASQPAGSYAFGCDIHPSMKGEMYVMEIPGS